MTDRPEKYRRQALFGVLLIALAMAGGVTSAAAARRVAVLAPDATVLSKKAVPIFVRAFSERCTVLDSDMADAAYEAARPETPFNMTAAQARTLASVVGADALVLVRSEILRRSSLERPEYYEAYVAVFVVDGRTGLLARSDVTSVDAPSQAAAENDSFEDAARAAAAQALESFDPPVADPGRPKLEELSGDTETPGVKPPAPYKRIKPEYPQTAYLYNVKATVEVEVDIDETGRVTRTSVVRWAGYGLDRAVVDAVRAMNWRPATRDGKPLAMRVLLRYNFTKVEKE